MVRKLKAMTEKKEDNQLASAIKDSAQQIWLAGLGAFAKAQEEGTKVFEALVQEGRGIQRRTRAMTEERIGGVSDTVTRVAGGLTKQATDSWDKLEQVFEDRVARALTRLGVPTNQDVQALIARVETLNASVQSLGGKPASAARGSTSRPAKAPARASAARSATAAAAPKPASRKRTGAVAGRSTARKTLSAGK
jgi:poly(hydroxyalkanoate) granule-associated protein